MKELSKRHYYWVKTEPDRGPDLYHGPFDRSELPAFIESQLQRGNGGYPKDFRRITVKGVEVTIPPARGEKKSV